jgi:hypothetical protein
MGQQTQATWDNRHRQHGTADTRQHGTTDTRQHGTADTGNMGQHTQTTCDSRHRQHGTADTATWDNRTKTFKKKPTETKEMQHGHRQ